MSLESSNPRGQNHQSRKTSAACHPPPQESPLFPSRLHDSIACHPHPFNINGHVELGCKGTILDVYLLFEMTFLLTTQPPPNMCRYGPAQNHWSQNGWLECLKNDQICGVSSPSSFFLARERLLRYEMLPCHPRLPSPCWWTRLFPKQWTSRQNWGTS